MFENIFRIQVVLVLFTIVFTVVRCRNREYLNPEWIDPHDREPVHKLRPQADLCEPCDNAAKSEYLRLVNTIFNPNEFRVSVIYFLVKTAHFISIKMSENLLFLFCSLMNLRTTFIAMFTSI